MRFLSFTLAVLAFGSLPVSAQTVTNTATVSPPAGVTNPGTACTAAGGTYTAATGVCSASDTDTVVAPQLTLTKTASAASFTVGVGASYTLSVQNTGTAATTAASTITDSIPTDLAIGTLPAGCAAAGQAVTCTIAAGLAAGANTSFIIPVTPAASAAASVTNTATVSGGGDPTCPATARCTSSVTTPVNRPQLTMTKTASAASFAVGVAASYTLQVSNTGTAATTAASTITDTIPTGLTIGTLPAGCAAAGQTVTCTIAAGLAAGANTSFIIPITPTLAAGASVTNSATVSGGGDSTCPAAARCTGSVTTPVFAPQLTMTKTASAASFTVGVAASYTLLVTNNGGTATTAAATITDTIPTGLTIGTLPAGCTAAGQTVTCTIPAGLAVGVNASFIIPITPTEAALPSVTNTATVSGGGDPTCPATARCTSTVTTPITFTAALTIDKTAGTPTGNTAGSTIGYSFLVTNTGNVTLTGLVINDAQLDAAATCPVTTLAPGTSTTCPGTHTITQAEVNAGTSNNSATATGTPPTGVAVTSAPDTTVTPIAASPLLNLTKTATPTTVTGAGSVISYGFVATNNGNVTLTNITVSDPLLPTLSCTAIPTLAPGASATFACTGNTYTVTQADLDNNGGGDGDIDNTATASGTTPGGQTATGQSSAAVTLPAPVASLTLDKSATVADTNGNTVSGDAGDVISYAFSASNTGTVTLAPVSVSDPQLPTLSCTIATLAPGATAACAATGNSYVISAADVSAGNVVNTATASGDAPGTIVDPSATDTVTVTTATLLIDAIDDDYSATPVNGTSGGNTPSVLANDTLNGQPVTVGAGGNAALAPGTSPNPGLEMNPDGTITIAAGTAAGTYVYPYTICEVLNPANCDTANATVVVGAAPIVAVDDSTATPINGAAGGIAIPNIFANDTLNGLAVVRADITVTNTTVPPQLVFDSASGQASVVAGSPAGTYTFDYTICELLNPTNCATAVVTVVVVAAPIMANDDAFPLVNGADGGTTVSVIGNDSLNGQPITLGAGGNATLTAGTSPAAGLTMNPDGTITIAPGTPAGTYQYPYTICEALNPSNCDTAIATVLVGAAVIDAVDDSFPSINSANGGTTPSVLGNDTLGGQPVTLATVTLTPGASPNPSGASPIPGLGMNADGTITIGSGTAAGTYQYPYTICEVLNPTNCDTAIATVTVVSDFALRLLKTTSVREVRIGDLVRYTVTVENVGDSDFVNGSIVDTPPAGFSYVEGSLTVVDGDNMATAAGQQPIRFEGIDVAAGETATLVYMMRVGAGVRAGAHANQAQAFAVNGQSVSNVSTVQVMLARDALVDDSLLLGTVFDDRDADGWQDSAALAGVRVQGGFAPGAYVANSTTVDRGAGPQSVTDASSPMLHGIDVGAISPRQSSADPVANHQVVIRQRLRELDFTSDFALTSAQGVTVRMDATGNTTVEKSGEAAKGLNAAEPKVERRVAQGEGGYVVDYVISNLGIDERGIPGVRIASVEGMLIETDQFGRYHLQGVAGGDLARGRNFILKVDPSTLPPGTVFTTDNPLVRRITPGVPVRFDFGVKLPVEEIQGGEQLIELELGEVVFAPGSAKLRGEYLPVVEQIAAKVAEYRGGEVLISANGDSEGLAFDRATAMKDALLEKLPSEVAKALTVSVRADVGDPSSMVVGVAEGGPLLGTVLFDTDQSTVKPQYLPMLDKVAAYLQQQRGGVVAIIGHSDRRGSDAYNIALGMRRAQAVYAAIAEKLSPEVRGKVRVESSNDPAAPAGNGK